MWAWVLLQKLFKKSRKIVRQRRWKVWKQRCENIRQPGWLETGKEMRKLTYKLEADRQTRTKNRYGRLYKAFECFSRYKKNSYSQRESTMIYPSSAGCPLGYVLIWLLLPLPEGCRMKGLSPLGSHGSGQIKQCTILFSLPFCSITSVRNPLSNQSPHSVNHISHYSYKTSSF